jgi:hypothetical protein
MGIALQVSYYEYSSTSLASRLKSSYSTVQYSTGSFLLPVGAFALKNE